MYWVLDIFQWLRFNLTTTDGNTYEIFNQPYPISIRSRYTCSVVHVGGSVSKTWMYAFTDNFSNQGISVRTFNNITQFEMKMIGCTVIIIGI